jgi:hypothetical protein
MAKRLSARETENEFYARAANEHARTLRRERRARVIRKLTSLRTQRPRIAANSQPGRNG